MNSARKSWCSSGVQYRGWREPSSSLGARSRSSEPSFARSRSISAHARCSSSSSCSSSSLLLLLPPGQAPAAAPLPPLPPSFSSPSLSTLLFLQLLLPLLFLSCFSSLLQLLLAGGPRGGGLSDSAGRSLPLDRCAQHQVLQRQQHLDAALGDSPPRGVQLCHPLSEPPEPLYAAGAPLCHSGSNVWPLSGSNVHLCTQREKSSEMVCALRKF